MANICKHNERAIYCWQCKDERIADLIERDAKLLKHAEAMARDMESSHKLWNAPSLLAYRADFPKEG